MSTRHEDFQSQTREVFGFPQKMSVEECVAKILSDEDLRHPVSDATEFLFGCEMNNLPNRNHDPALWDLFNGLWDGDDVKLLKTIAKNHEWCDRKRATKVLCFQIYESEFFLITGGAIDEVFDFMVSR